MSHQTAPIELRERLAYSQAEIPEALSLLVGSELIKEAVLLSTCNRTEIYAFSEKPEHAAQAALDFFQRDRSVSSEEIERHFYDRVGVEAVKHLYRVASGMDSMVLGEPQILGQVKEAYRIAIEANTTGVLLNKLFHKAFQAAKRIRTETRIGNYAVSVASTAVELATKIFGDLKFCAVLLVGAGNMGELTAQHLVGAGAASITVTNRTPATAQSLATRFGGAAAPFDDLAASISRADIVISTTGAPRPIITYKMAQEALRARRHKPIFLIDIAVPRDIEAKVVKLEGAYVYNIDDLQEIALRNREEREKEAAAAEVIVAEEVSKFIAWESTLGVVPTIVSLRGRFEEVAGSELKKTLDSMPEMDEHGKKAVELLAHNIVNKLLHEPSIMLKHCAESGDGEAAKACQILFKLQIEAEEGIEDTQEDIGDEE